MEITPLDFSDFLEVLAKIAESKSSVFIRTIPEILDFTDKELDPPILMVCDSKNTACIQINDEDIPLILETLQVAFFESKKFVISWNWKNIQSWSLNKTKNGFIPENTIIDLKPLEQHAGIHAKGPPKTFTEANNRIKNLVGSGAWEASSKIYKKIFFPLITDLIPRIENTGVLNLEQESRVHAYYDLFGQENGRFLCDKYYKKGFVPHTIGPQERQQTRPVSLDEFFLYFDYCNMEVSMLAWLSNDKRLKYILSKNVDFYKVLYKLVIGKDPTDEDRKKSKKFFLPVIYGQQAFGLSKSLNVSAPTAEKIISRLTELFPEAFSWIENYVETSFPKSKKDYAEDFFGKRRYFLEDDELKIKRQLRNFCVQSPASLVCTEKLVQLGIALKGKTDIAYHVHDGYVVYANSTNFSDVYKITKKTLISDSAFCPGIRLSVSCKKGRNLDTLVAV